ncbi:S41 family peptidase [Marinoscillum pacificum]|uniref:S41 family peptidase n=1 Tax=Marinoscillum pacificum TaxID=392723 RepID=UPI002157055A|nr:S41 family peptidase [Marinoscillum pacificum]
MRFIAITFLLINGLNGFAQLSIDSISYKNDLAIFRKALEETHPSLYRFTSKEKFDSLFDLTASNLSPETTELDFFRSIAKIMSLVREGHSFVRPTESISSTINDKNLFPFQVLVEDSFLTIKNSRSKELAYLEGAKIDSINGQSVPSILKLLSESTCTVSAFNTSGLKSRLSLYDNFALAFYYFIDTTASFHINYRTESTAKPISLKIEGTNTDLSGTVYPKLPPEPKPPFTLQIDQQNSLATIRISTFAYWMADKKIKDYSRFFKETFATLQSQKIKNLIIDVRGNRGGEEMLAAEFLTYLIDHEFSIYKYCRTKMLDFDFTNSLPNSKKVSLSKGNYQNDGEEYFMKKADFLKSFTPQTKLHFGGSVYIISNGVCASACNTFLSLVKTHRVGLIVGQESGGAFEDVDGRQRISFTLPYSNIFVSYPAWSMKLNTSGGDSNRGVIPDYEIKPTVDNGIDEEKQFTLGLINQKLK